MTTKKHSLCARVASLLLVLMLSSCGTLIFQERHGQPRGQVDPNIVVLDGIGLLFFVVPGLVAFGVDLATGSIYLPDGVERGEGPFWSDDSKKESDDDE